VHLWLANLYEAAAALHDRAAPTDDEVPDVGWAEDQQMMVLPTTLHGLRACTPIRSPASVTRQRPGAWRSPRAHIRAAGEEWTVTRRPTDPTVPQHRVSGPMVTDLSPVRARALERR
jgi:hypothetical protein